MLTGSNRLAWIALLLVGVFALSLFLGRYPQAGFLSPDRLASDERAQRLLLNLLLPRLLTAVMLGMSLAAAAAVVSVCDMVGWVGLIVPHIARRLFGADSRRASGSHADRRDGKPHDGDARQQDDWEGRVQAFADRVERSWLILPICVILFVRYMSCVLFWFILVSSHPR